MATSKTLTPTNVTIQIPEFTDLPDQRVNSNCIDKEADAINTLNNQMANRFKWTYVGQKTTAANGITPANPSIDIPSSATEFCFMVGSSLQMSPISVEVMSNLADGWCSYGMVSANIYSTFSKNGMSIGEISLTRVTDSTGVANAVVSVYCR